MTEDRRKQFDNVLAPVVEAMGFEYVGCEFISQGRHSLVRVYVDKANGLTIDDCAEISHQLSGVLDVEDLIKAAYNLEISSPGLDRPLFTLPQFIQAVGQKVRVRLSLPVNEQRNFTGTLKAIIDENIVLDVDAEEITIPYASIAKANIIYQFK